MPKTRPINLYAPPDEESDEDDQPSHPPSGINASIPEERGTGGGDGNRNTGMGRGITQLDGGPFRGGRSIVNRVLVQLEHVYAGEDIEVTVERNIKCPSCKGLGGEVLSVMKCHGCKGALIRIVMKETESGVQPAQIACPDCKGWGKIVNYKEMCDLCSGGKVLIEHKTLPFHIGKGIKDGTGLIFEKEGNQSPDNNGTGDVLLLVMTEPHPRFQRKGNDLFHNTKIDLLTALAGGRIAIEHLDGRWLHVKIKAGEVIRPGEVKIVMGQGMPIYKGQGYGNLYIEFNVQFPQNNFNNIEKILALKQILPCTNQSVVPAGAKYVVEAQVQEIAEGHVTWPTGKGVPGG